MVRHGPEAPGSSIATDALCARGRADQDCALIRSIAEDRESPTQRYIDPLVGRTVATTNSVVHSDNANQDHFLSHAYSEVHSLQDATQQKGFVLVEKGCKCNICKIFLTAITLIQHVNTWLNCNVLVGLRLSIDHHQAG